MMRNNESKAGYSDKWGTPKEVYDPLNAEFQFNCDPCPLGWKEGDPDALQMEWGSSTFLNPPYSRVAEFVKKATEEVAKGKTVVLLVNACTDTRWFHDYVYQKPGVELRFLKGRIKFVDPANPTKRMPAPRPSLVAVMRPQQPQPVST